MKSKLKQGFTLIELLVVITIIAILASLAVPTFNVIQDKANQMKGTSNCRQIIIAMKAFASDNNGAYPDSDPGFQPQTANDAFRLLLIQDILQDERIFGCPASPFIPDGNVGQPPQYTEAVMAGENHWVLTQGQTDSSSAIMPLVFENPVSPGWPPSWNADVAGQLQPGRTWRGGKVIIGLNDNSVSVERLEAARGSNVGPRPLGGVGMNMFTQASQTQQVLNVIPRN
jgi:prepilin-type N-terminal cleavage/methylation domain-containing protein